VPLTGDVYGPGRKEGPEVLGSFRIDSVVVRSTSASDERTRVLELIRKLSAGRRTTFAIVEHDMDVVFSLAEWIVVMNRGEVLAEGAPAEIRENRAVREVYLGA